MTNQRLRVCNYNLGGLSAKNHLKGSQIVCVNYSYVHTGTFLVLISNYNRAFNCHKKHNAGKKFARQ